jgi:serine/threonine-protein kinase
VGSRTSLYDASFGRAGGGNIQVITKSGTNAFHGDAYEYSRNDAHAVGIDLQPARWRRALPWAVAVGALVVAGAVAWIVGSRSSVSAPSVARVMIDVRPADGLLGPLGDSETRRPTRTAMALSPDGRQLVFSAREGDTQQLYLRAIDRSEATSISGTKGADSPFFSPDGQWVGFWANGAIKKVCSRWWASGGRLQDRRSLRR